MGLQLWAAVGLIQGTPHPPVLPMPSLSLGRAPVPPAWPFLGAGCGAVMGPLHSTMVVGPAGTFCVPLPQSLCHKCPVLLGSAGNGVDVGNSVRGAGPTSWHREPQSSRRVRAAGWVQRSDLGQGTWDGGGCSGGSVTPGSAWEAAWCTPHRTDPTRSCRRMEGVSTRPVRLSGHGGRGPRGVLYGWGGLQLGCCWRWCWHSSAVQQGSWAPLQEDGIGTSIAPPGMSACSPLLPSFLLLTPPPHAHGRLRFGWQYGSLSKPIRRN